VVGLDRFDYTKGIPERLMAVDRLLTLSPEWRGRLLFVQAGVPSRSRIPAYRSLWRRIERLVRQINQRHGHGGWAPIVLLPGEPLAHRHPGALPPRGLPDGHLAP
jgi:trehalose 6-phosphate synthase